jgi:hypothetical protein
MEELGCARYPLPPDLLEIALGLGPCLYERAVLDEYFVGHAQSWRRVHFSFTVDGDHNAWRWAT